METKEMTPSESLQIISSYIEESRKDFIKANGAPLILWGSVLMGVSIAIFILWRCTGNPAWNFGWFALPVIGGALTALFFKHSEQLPKNIINTTVASTWGVFGIISILFSVTVLIVSYLNPAWSAVHHDIISVSILLLLGICEAITGAVLNKKWIIVLGITTSLVLSFTVTMIPSDCMPLIMFSAGFLSLFLPGIIIRRN